MGFPHAHYSYCSACSTFSRAARRAGKIAATMPTITAAIAKMMICADRERELDEVHARDEERAEDDSEHDPEDAADERRDHALVADHPPHLPARHPDRAQHPDLARPLEHRQHERVDDPEQADDHGQREQHVEDVEDRVQPEIWLSMNSSRVATFAFGNSVSVCSSAACVRVGLAALGAHERVEVARLRGCARPRSPARS